VELSRRRLLLAALPLCWPGVASAQASPLVVIQPLGPGANSAEVVSAALSAFYVIELKVQPRLGLPGRAYYRPRGRYRAEVLLEELEKGAPAGAKRVLGLTNVDISTSKPPYDDWGILGLASLGGRACVLSSFRCKRKAKNVAHALQRLAKTAVHELGHTFGLAHCPNIGCIMEDGGGSVLTTDHERDLCAECREKLNKTGYLRAGAISPWA
jgi:archaemetzincin